MLKAKNILGLLALGFCFLSTPTSLHAEDAPEKLRCPEAAKYQQGKVLETSSSQRTSTYVSRGFSQHFSPGHPDYRYGDYQTEDKSDIYRMYIQEGDWVYKVERKMRPHQQPGWKLGDEVALRISGNKMYLKKDDGKELKMKIVERKVADNKL